MATNTPKLGLVNPEKGKGEKYNLNLWTENNNKIDTFAADASAQLEDKATKTYSNTLIDEASTVLLGVDAISLDWVRGDIQSGNINTLATNGAVSNNYIDLDKDVEIVLKPNQGIKGIVAYYTLTGVFIGTYSPWFTANYKIPKADNRKVRLQLRHTDDRLNIIINDLVKNISILKRNISVDLLNERLKTLEGVNEIPSYWQTHLADKITLINAIQRDIGYNGTSFAFITDIHWNANSKNSPKLLKKVVEECNIPYIIDGGDLASNPLGVSKVNQIKELIEAKKTFGMEDKLLRALGNHDDNSINDLYSMTINDKELYDILYRGNSDIPKIKSGKTGAYHYVDDEMHKIRYIVLNAIDIPYVQTAGDTLQYNGMDHWVFRQEQIDWFADVALNVPDSNYAVVVCSHIPINQGLILNDSIAMNILQAFKVKTSYTGSGNIGTDFEVSKSVDYTGKGGDVICWIAGHQHVDNYITLPGNITYKMVVTINDSLAIKSGQAIKTLGTATENAFDVFIINKATRNVTIKRIGAGADRSFDY